MRSISWTAKICFDLSNELNLSRLSADRIEAICRHQTQGKALPKTLLRQIIDKTNGVPLFVEELTRMIIESDLMEEKKDHFEISPAVSVLPYMGMYMPRMTGRSKTSRW